MADAMAGFILKTAGFTLREEGEGEEEGEGGGEGEGERIKTCMETLLGQVLTRREIFCCVCAIEGFS